MKSKTMKKSLGMLLLVASTTAVASKWLQLNDKNGVKTSVDMSSIAIQDTHRSIWVRTQVSPAGEVEGTRYDTILTYNDIDCANNSVALKQVFFKLDERVQKNFSAPPSPILPDSTDEVLRDTLCKLNGSKRKG